MKVYPYVLYRPNWILVTFEITEAISKTINKRTLTATRSQKEGFIDGIHTHCPIEHTRGHVTGFRHFEKTFLENEFAEHSL